MTARFNRPAILPGQTHKIVVGLQDGPVKIYLTVCEHNGKPMEIFINSKNSELAESMGALTIMVSRRLQDGGSVEEIAADLEEVPSAMTGHMMNGGWCPSIHARIGRELLVHVKKLEAA